jgi:methyl-accepting chemotaxis protein
VSQNVQEAVKGVNDIVREIAELATGTTEIARAAGEAAEGINMVAGNVTSVSDAATDTAKGASETNINAEELTGLATRLEELMGQFTVGAPKFNIAGIKGAHLKWRMRLEHALHGHEALASADVTGSHQCAFGKWYDSPEGQALNTYPMFTAIGTEHEGVPRLVFRSRGLLPIRLAFSYHRGLLVERLRDQLPRWPWS